LRVVATETVLPFLMFSVTLRSPKAVALPEEEVSVETASPALPFLMFTVALKAPKAVTWVEEEEEETLAGAALVFAREEAVDAVGPL
jgi:uncharacterized membrane protein